MSPRDKQAAAQRKAQRLEAERLEAEAQARRKRLAYVVAGALALAAIVAVVLIASGGGDSGTGGEGSAGNAYIEPLSGSDNDVAPDERPGADVAAVQQRDLQQAAKRAGCELRLDLPDEGNAHLQPNQPPPAYKTNPPTSGDHVTPPLQQADGAYAEPPEPVNYVHSLEHSRVEIQYSPDLTESAQLKLKGVFDADPAGMLLFPNPEMPYEVAATAWTQLMGCKTYAGAATLDAIRDFRDAYRGNGPEDVPIELGG